MNDRLVLAIAAILGVPAVLIGYISLVEATLGRLHHRRARRLRPWLWLGPALAFLGVLLPYPAALIVAGAWIWTCLAPVILSAGLKGVPAEVLEAARVVGAGEWQTFWRIVVPLSGSTISVVATVMVVTALKAFDIVYVMTSG